MPPKRQSNVSLSSGRSQSRKRTHGRPGTSSAVGSSHGHVRRSGDEGEGGEDDARKRRRIEPSAAGPSSSKSKSRRELAHEGSASEEADEGDDSEGNEWRLGQVGSEEDSDIDSDEAFGDDDEERFGGFAFRGSSSTKTQRAQGSHLHQKGERSPGAKGGVSRGEEAESYQVEEEDDLGDEAIDLAAVLDESGSEDGTTPDTSGDEGDQDDDGHSEATFSASEDEPDDHDASRLSTLQSLVASLEPQLSKGKERSYNSVIESKSPSEFGLTASQKLTVADLLPSVTDPSMKRSLKLLAADKNTKASKTGAIPGKLEVPLAKRQQDRIDRAAAYEKSKQTLDRWIDTVKYNRRAEHLSFPLVDQDDVSAKTNKQLGPQANSAPLNELESTIQNILSQSGLAPSGDKTEEQRLQASEDLESKKLPLEEVQARRTQLRMARELLFREEARSKRIKKIKSKSYRRVHRKQRERADQEERAALEAAGVGLSDEEESRHRRRAEERMGARHRESKWAKGVKASGRGAWDADARAGVSELARKGDELTQRIQGKPVRRQDGEGSDIGSLSESSSADSESDDEEGQARQGDRLKKRLNDVDGEPGTASAGATSLSSMKFMQRAEAARAQENDDAVKQLKRELAGELSSSDEEPQTVGRRAFGPKVATKDPRAHQQDPQKNEFEEKEDPDTELSEADEARPDEPSVAVSELPGSLEKTSRRRRRAQRNKQQQSATRSEALNPGASAVKLPLDSEDPKAQPPQPQPDSSKGQSNGMSSASGLHKASVNSEAWPTVHLGQASDSSDSEDDEESSARPAPLTSLDQQDLRLRAFATDDVDLDFEQEKRRIMEEEDDQVIDQTLPGWGSWTGTGISKRQQERNKGRVVTKIAGVAPGKRRDAKLDRVIVNEKRTKKNDRYLASSLPHPFETRQQYERSLRLPVGPEWTTKETFQDATKPRVLIKPGIIEPLKKPLI